MLKRLTAVGLATRHRIQWCCAATGPFEAHPQTKAEAGPQPTEPIDPDHVEISIPTVPSLENIEEAALAALHHNRHVNAKDAVVVDEAKSAPQPPPTPTSTAPNAIPKKKVRFVSPQESIAIEFQKMAHRLSQSGPYVGRRLKDEPVTALDFRKRREIERVMPFKQPWQGYETSFRRLPKGAKIPEEHELRALYPMKTKLHIDWDEAHCADLNALDPMEAPLPIKFGKLLPPNYDPNKSYPTLVVLPDNRGLEVDFEDMCAHFFERPNVSSLVREQQWVVLAPIVNQRHSVVYPIEGIIARFCDWVPTKFNVEHGKVHLFGKGLGGHTALRTCIEYKEVAKSVTALLGRLSTPFRPMDRPMEKLKNLNGTHSLIIVPGLVRKPDYAYRFKIMGDFNQLVPPIRCIHYADVRDHQIYYALNPYELFSHLKFFRSPDSITPTTQRRWEMDTDFDPDDITDGESADRLIREKVSQVQATTLPPDLKEMPIPK
jgi:hypothetical protein